MPAVVENIAKNQLDTRWTSDTNHFRRGQPRGFDSDIVAGASICSGTSHPGAPANHPATRMPARTAKA
jgi:hypothetical protein